MFDDTRPLRVQKAWAEGISDHVGVEQSFNLGEKTVDDQGNVKIRPGGRQLIAQVYDLFTMRSYQPFSNTSWTPRTEYEPSKVEDYKSLEAVHNNVHVFLGGLTYGYMSMNDVAAFDPVFWMHHGYVYVV